MEVKRGTGTADDEEMIPSLTLIRPTIGIRPTLVITPMQPLIGYTQRFHGIFIQCYSDNYVNDYALQHGSLEIQPESTQSPLDSVIAV